MKTLLLAVLILCGTIATQAQGKTGYISTDEVFANIPQSRVADSIIQIEANKLNNAYKNREDEINDLVSAFLKDSVNMTKEVKEVKRKGLQDKISGLSELKKQLENDLEEYKNKTYTPVKEKVLIAIRDIAKAKGYTTCLYRESALFFPPADDMTKAVIKKLGGK